MSLGPRSSYAPKRRMAGINGNPSCLAMVAALILLATSQVMAALPIKPTRILIITDARARDGYVYRDAGELSDSLALMTLWGIPHDVLRLDTQTLRTENLLNAAGQPTYGAILWAVRSDFLPRKFQEGEILREACLKHHISLIAFGGRIDVPAIQEILGLRLLGTRDATAPIVAPLPRHFITRQDVPLPNLAGDSWLTAGPMVEPTSADTQVLLRAGDQPFLTARTLDVGTGTRAVWFGGDANRVLSGEGQGLAIHLFQRSLIWCLGAAIIHEYDNSLLLRMDDPGTAQAGYLQGYEHASLSEALIKEDILAPLRKHHARLSIFACPGYVDAQSHTIRHTEQVDEIDAFGNAQNNHEMYAAFLDGVRNNLLDIESHGWTHMAPDLDSPAPSGTNWWSGSIWSEWADYRWYREFYDLRREREIPAKIQRLHMKNSCDWLEQYFGIRPTAFCPPGHDVSGNSFIYPQEMDGTVEIQIEGAEPRATYNILAGEDEDWIVVGTMQTDAAGTTNVTLDAPDELWLAGRGYFTFNKPGGRSLFIAGPIHDGPGFDFSYAIRDRGRMTPAEREAFPGSGPTLRQGKIVGHLDRRTYRPAFRSPLCTYQIAGRCGFGMFFDTQCHALTGSQVVSMRMIPVISWPEDIDENLSRRAGMPTVWRFHDSDLDQEPTFILEALNMVAQRSAPVTYMGADELAAYTHATWTLQPAAGETLSATVDLSSPACRYLNNHDSAWTLLATDETLAALKNAGKRIIAQDAASPMQSLTTSTDAAGQTQLRVPAGPGARTYVIHAQ